MRRLSSSLIVPLLIASAGAGAPGPTGQEVLEKNCASCHAQASPMGGLDLRTRESALKGGRRGPAIVPGQAASSLIVQAVEGAGELKMPPGKKLPADEIAALREWIEKGAPWQQQDTKKSPNPDDVWAFQPLRRISGAASVDSFI